jgi:hypothetical protein
MPTRLTGLDFTLHPRRLLIRYRTGQLDSVLCVLDPGEFGRLCDVMEHCWEMRIIDTNAEDRGQRQFGRYRLEFWDEDGPIGTVLADGFEV